VAVKSFKDLIVWQNARVFTVHAYNAFGMTRDYGFRDQIQWADISIMNNISEGHAKRSDKAFRNFLYIALGSAAEVESMLLVAGDLEYINLETQQSLLQEVDSISRLLNAFIRKLAQSSSLPGRQPTASRLCRPIGLINLAYAILGVLC